MSQTTVKLKLQKSLNRAVVLTAFPMARALHISVLFHKQHCGLQFQIDSKNGMIQERMISIRMHRNLEECQFCNVFLNLQNVTNDKFDFRNKYSGLNKDYSKHIFCFFDEKLNLLPEDEHSNKSNNNYLWIMGWKTHAVEDELIYYFVQRKSYNPVTRLVTARTAGLCLSTQRGDDILRKYHNDYLNSVKKVNSSSIPDFLEASNKRLEVSSKHGN